MRTVFNRKRIPRLLRLAEGQACVMCGRDDGTVVAAHSNELQFGKGMGTKAHDGASAWLCMHCHMGYDQGVYMDKTERRLFILEAIAKTYIQLWEQGLIEVRNGNSSSAVPDGEE